MKRQILIAVAIWSVALFCLVLYLHWKYQERYPDVQTESVTDSSAQVEEVEPAADSHSDSPPAMESPQYQCSGKVYCSEMSSCAEAMFYLQNCPETKMDGDKDGIPCEDQWCGHDQVTALMQMAIHRDSLNFSADSNSAVSQAVKQSEYQCDGKRKCSQMTSCEEATFYLQNCPATIMDGDNDGVPCENELCEENGKYSYPPVAYSPGNPDTGKGFSYTYGTVEPYTDSSSSSSSDFLGVTETSASRCAGKTWCSQMSSCAEAMFYLQNCPGTKMDGDNDGIPCEDQWCGH